jgi:hypothetical protein
VIRSVLSALVVSSLLAGTPPARGDDVAEARAHLRKGTELFRAGRHRDAIAEFEAAYRLKPHGAIHFNVAQCRERLSEWPGALRAWHDYLREVPDASDRAAVRAAIGRIEERLASAGVQTLLVYSDPPGAEVRLDGRPRGATPFHLVLPPGTYALALSLDGHASFSEEVALGAAGSRVVEVALRPAAPAPPAVASEPAPAAPPDAAAAPSPAAPPAPASVARPPVAPDLRAKPHPTAPLAAAPLAPAAPAPPREKRRVYTWIAAGAAAVAFAAGAWYGLAARSDEEAMDGIVGDGALAERTARDARANARRANVLYAVAGGAAAAGVTLFFVEKRF